MTNSNKTDKNPSDPAPSKKAEDASAFLAEAYDLKDKDSMKKFYARWADDYDNQIENLDYLSPQLIGQAMQKYLTDKNAKILDVGCGTGLTANEMFKAGYTNLYGIDLSEDMVQVAQNRGIYNGVKAGDITLALEYEDNEFDGVISSGTFTHGHVGSEPLYEIFRIIQPNGVLACTVHQDLWQSREFDRVFQDLEKQNQIRCLSLEFDRYFENEEPTGWFCVYQKI